MGSKNKYKNKKLWMLSFTVACMLFMIAKSSLSNTSLDKSKIVRIMSEQGMCSGEQIKAPSGATYILSASHCKKLMGKDGFEIHTEDGKVLKRRLIDEDPTSDLILIEGLPNVDGIEIASHMAEGDKIRTLSHGENMDTYETDGEIIQMTGAMKAPLYVIDSEEAQKACSGMIKYEIYDGPFGKICVLSVDETVSTALVAPGSSGGAVFNEDGKLVGVISAKGENFSMFVTLSDVRSFVRNY